jgi:Flp pilus assembly protein TadD
VIPVIMRRRRTSPRHLSVTPIVEDPVEALIGRARRLRTKGEHRKAFALLREACALDEWRGRPSALLGAWLVEEGLEAEAAQRIRHAQWLFRRAGEEGRARALDRFLARARAA